MPERDFVGDPVKYSFSGVIPIDDVYKALVKWSKLYQYFIIEKEHKTAALTDSKSHVFNWTLVKKATDYVKYMIDVEIKVLGLKEVKTKEARKKYYQGSLQFLFSAYLFKDYEDMYGKNPIVKFMRESYDKFVTENKMRGFEKELMMERNKLISEIKSFLNLQKLTEKEEK